MMNKPKNLAPILILISVCGYILNIFFHKYMTHHLSADNYGDFCIALNVLEFAATFILFGTELSAMRYIPLSEENSTLKFFIGWNFFFVRKIFFIYCGFTMVAFIIFILIKNNFPELFDLIHIAIFMLFIAPIVALYDLLIAYLNSNNRIIKSALIDYLCKSILIWLMVIILSTLMGVQSQNTIIIGSYFVSFFILIMIALKIYNHYFEHISPLNLLLFPSEDYNEENTQWRNSSFKYAIANVVFLVFMYMDKFILEIVHPTEDLVGHYSVLVILVGLFALISQSSAVLISPHISKLISHKDTIKELQTIINKANSITVLLALMLFAAYLFWGEYILGFYGKHGEYANVYHALIWLAFSQLLLETGKLALRFLLYGGFTGYINKVFCFSVLILLVSGSTLTYWFGLNGIIAAHIITSFIYMLVYVLKVKKEFKEIKVFSFY